MLVFRMNGRAADERGGKVISCWFFYLWKGSQACVINTLGKNNGSDFIWRITKQNSCRVPPAIVLLIFSSFFVLIF